MCIRDRPPTYLSLMIAPGSGALEDHGTRGRGSTKVSFLRRPLSEASEETPFFFFGLGEEMDKLVLNIITSFTVEFEILILTFKN